MLGITGDTDRAKVRHTGRMMPILWLALMCTFVSVEYVASLYIITLTVELVHRRSPGYIISAPLSNKG